MATSHPKTTVKPGGPVIPPIDAPLLNQENFEKELKALASKAQEETWPKWARGQAWVLIQSGTLLTLAAIYSNISQLTLSPVYGGIPSSIWHSKGVMTASFLGWSSNLFLKRRLPVKPAQLLPLIAAYIPMAQFFLFKLSSFFGAVYGPLITESLTYLPLLLLSVSCTATILDDLEMNPGRLQWAADAAPGILSYAFFKTMEFASNSKLQSTIGASFIQTRLGLQIFLAGLYSIFAPSKLLLLTIPAVLHTALFNVHVPYPHTTSVLHGTLAKNGWSLIERHESLTGYISIIESAEKGFRVMRCDHSLLGGEWLATARHRVAEPIYGIFVMLEAVRLIEVSPKVPDKDAKALVIGLGIGTTPAALMAHGIDTTIVEIDPIVYAFATKYFSLPRGHTAVIADAVSYTSQLARTSQKFDYVVHDVFTGGAEPVDLFTFEFVQDLHSILKPGGVIAINYAGDLLLPSARIIIHTITTVFPSCRLFRENESPSPSTIAADGRDFTNMVIFCTNSDEPVSFRKPMTADFLGSGARKAFLLPKHEVEEESFARRENDGGVLFKNGTERFSGWQQTSALGHWAVMRTVLPKEVWEDW
ncbi:Polyamine aminopropyltransferase [Hyphodiscus hymeniophilus]|uniref:Polyamine aminopropyltransferase n=1 Tax=Hyphodiscus hymeniophilus TaxID=353542 RepID=A0A9P7AY43_9HELO|nr:Polyamine aminopropyltransferase [Hyphodiscus hymeniophilus]